MVETGRTFYLPEEKVRGLVSNADLPQYRYPVHNKCSLLLRDREYLIKYKSDLLVKIHL